MNIWNKFKALLDKHGPFSDPVDVKYSKEKDRYYIEADPNYKCYTICVYTDRGRQINLYRRFDYVSNPHSHLANKNYFFVDWTNPITSAGLLSSDREDFKLVICKTFEEAEKELDKFLVEKEARIKKAEKERLDKQAWAETNKSGWVER